MNDFVRKYDVQWLRNSCLELLTAAGAHETIARDVTTSLIATSLRGIDTHGLAMLPKILSRCEARRCQVQNPATIEIDNAELPIAVIDARLTPGQHSCLVASRIAKEKAKRFAVGIATVRNSTHFGACTPYLFEILKEGFVAWVGSNSSQSMAAFGAEYPNLGNNPFGFGAPLKNGKQFIFDFSSAVMSFGKLANYKKQGISAPLNSFIRPKNAPGKEEIIYEIAGKLTEVALPFGSFKGASVAMIIEILSGVLSDGHFGSQTESINGGVFLGPSHFAFAINPEFFFDSSERFQELMQKYIDDVRCGDPDIRIPGDAADKIESERIENGIPLADNLLVEFKKYSQKLNCSFTWD
jgi:LDH2 family malate/lactate/ureidoglycolate dehydrogenase